MIDLIKIFDYAKEDLWRDIKGYEGLYQVSHTGKVRSLNYLQTERVKELKPWINMSGYYQVKLCKNGKIKVETIHRLVASAFLINVDNKPCIDHIDTDGLNNHVTNLRYCTYKENANNETTKVNYALSKLGKKHPKAKSYFLYDKNKNFILKVDTKGQLAFYLSKFSNLKERTIKDYLNKKHKKSIVNTGILFVDKFYIYDFELEDLRR